MIPTRGCASVFGAGVVFACGADVDVPSHHALCGYALPVGATPTVSIVETWMTP